MPGSYRLVERRGMCVFINRIRENRNLLITCDLLIAFKERVRLFLNSIISEILVLIICSGYCAGERWARERLIIWLNWQVRAYYPGS